jgi:hypothetical protein
VTTVALMRRNGELSVTPARCIAFRAGEDDEYGRLVHHRGDRWAFWYAQLGDQGEEPIFRFDRHRFIEGEYVSITEHDGVQRTFRVAEVVPVL